MVLIFKFLDHLLRGYAEGLWHSQHCQHHEQTADSEGAHDRHPDPLCQGHRLRDQHHGGVAGDGRSLQTQGADLVREDLILDHVKEVVCDGDGEAEEEEPGGLQDLFGLGALLALLAGAEEEKRDGDTQGDGLGDVDDPPPLEVVDNEVAEDARDDLREADEGAVEVDTEGVVLEGEFGGVELEGGEEVQDDTHDRDVPEGVEPEEVQDRDHIVVLLFLVLLVLCSDVSHLLQCELVIVFPAVPDGDAVQDGERLLWGVVDDKIEGGFLNVEEETGQAGQQRDNIVDRENQLPFGEYFEEKAVQSDSEGKEGINNDCVPSPDLLCHGLSDEANDDLHLNALGCEVDEEADGCNEKGGSEDGKEEAEQVGRHRQDHQSFLRYQFREKCSRDHAHDSADVDEGLQSLQLPLALAPVVSEFGSEGGKGGIHEGRSLICGEGADVGVAVLLVLAGILALVEEEGVEEGGRAGDHDDDAPDHQRPRLVAPAPAHSLQH